ncbi:MAG TPA: class I SAM-dependent methyltransferase [Elusimicrobiales bacterium]|nr:class I SAM-dependent methyltransferase [Elusimicrobiales bacterium]
MNCPVCGSDSPKKGAALGTGALHACGACSVRFISPQPTDAELRAVYGEGYYKSWGLSGTAENERVKAMKTATFELRLDLISRYKSSGDILDVGCATGYFLEAAEKRGFQPYGVEISYHSSAAAKEKFGADRVHAGVLEDAPFRDGQFDVIAMSDLLEHVRDPLRTLAAARRLLKDDGAVMIMTPDTDSLTARMMGARWTHYKPEHLFYFNRRSLSLLAKKSGFEAVDFEAAKKAMNLEYIRTQFAVYPHWLLSPASALFTGMVPRALRSRNFLLTIGEMTAILRPAR